MTFLAPGALWFLLLGGAVVALYLLRIKRRSATVPALDFWLNLAGRTKVHSLWDRLKRLLSMLLWLAIVVCLIMALGNPIFSAGRIKPRAIAVVIDNSASMQTAEPGEKGRTRLELARRAVDQLASRRPVDDEWLLIEAGREARVLQPWTLDAGAVRHAAGNEGLKPFSGAGSLSTAIELAGQLLAGKPDPCIVVISDGAAGTFAKLADSDKRIVYWPIGGTSDNLGITRLAVRSDRRRSNYQALLAVTNASDKTVKSQVTLSIDGSTQSVEPFEIEPRGTWEKTLVIEPPPGVLATGGVLRAQIDRPDALAIDNEALAVLAPTRPAVVWLVTAPDTAYFFEQALGTMDPLVWAEQSLTMTPQRYEQAAAAIVTAPLSPSGTARTTNGADPASPLPPPVHPPDLIVFNGWAPDKLPPRGRFVFIGALPKDVGAAVNGTLEAPQLFLDPRPHPLTEHVSLQGARLIKALNITLNQPVRVLASTDQGQPLLFLSDQGERQSLCIGFDVLESDLPFRNAFPLLLRNAVATMNGDAEPLLRPRYTIGERITPARPLPSSVSKVAVSVQRGPTPETSELPVENGRFTFTDTLSPALVRLNAGDESALAAVSLLNADESRIEPVPAPADAAQTLGLTRRLFSVVPWVGLTALVTLLVGLEWLTYHLRWTE